VQVLSEDLIIKHQNIIIAVIVVLISIFSIITLTNISRTESIIYKISTLCVFSFFAILLVLFLLKKSGLLNNLSSFSELKAFINGFGAYSIIIYVIIQFLQVVVLPLPSVLIIGVGVFLFGPINTIILSSIGIIFGSIVAFLVGRYFGCRVVKWIIGEKSLNKILNITNGKDKILITFMLLFPFFPDDAICFVAGITKISSKYFIVMIIIVRIITITFSSLSINNSIIPFNTWWGILLWGLFFIITIFLTVYIYKHIENIKNKFINK
jgi:uncharacterized membrane protein YdjX (TVP38/TMEM64 family)